MDERDVSPAAGGSDLWPAHLPELRPCDGQPVPGVLRAHSERGPVANLFSAARGSPSDRFVHELLFTSARYLEPAYLHSLHIDTALLGGDFLAWRLDTKLQRTFGPACWQVDFAWSRRLGPEFFRRWFRERRRSPVV